MKHFLTLLLLLPFTLASLAAGQASPMLGNWSEPTGSVIRIESCPGGLCMRVLVVSPKAPVKTDIKNPDSQQRQRPLCNLEIARGFQMTDATHASGGLLYDPVSGRSYHGTITMAGADLKLRGYIGISIFGRSEIWHRAAENTVSCSARPTR